MPRKPLKPCSHPACGVLVRGAGKCPKHRTNRQAERDRGTRQQRGYGKSWQRLRLLILDRDPICCECGRAASTEVDHKVPMSQGGSTDDPDNLAGICKPCHGRKSVKEDGGFGRLRKTGNSA